MPKKIDPAVRERVMRMIAEHRSEYATPTELARVLAARERLGLPELVLNVDLQPTNRLVPRVAPAPRAQELPYGDRRRACRLGTGRAAWRAARRCRGSWRRERLCL